MQVRPPRHPALRGVVELLWVGSSASAAGAARPELECVIPTGQIHVSWRACGTPIRLGVRGEQVERCGVVGGARTEAHVHDAPVGARSVGALLVAGAAPRLFGASARSFAGLHVGLDALWGADARILQDQLGETCDDAALDRVERALVAHLRSVPRPPGLGEALRLLDRGASVGWVAARLGRSPRALGSWFDDAVGLSPSGWARVRRLQRALDHAALARDWSDVAHRAGYADHAHLCREFRAIAGVTPSDWRARSTERNHVPITASDPFKRGSGV